MGITGTRGRAGEDLAAAYLALSGARVLERNVRLAGVEVDLVAEDGGAHVVVEVKYRGRGDYGGAAAAIDHTKRERLRRAALALQRGSARRVRIDVIAIELDPDGARLTHYRNAIEG